MNFKKLHTYHDIMYGDFGLPSSHSDTRKEMKQDKKEGYLNNRMGKFIDIHGIEKWISETLGDAEY